MIRDKLLLDVGGTFIKCSDGRTIPIDSDGTNDEIASALRSAVFGEGEPPKAGIRVAIPGPFDYKNGVFLILLIPHFKYVFSLSSVIVPGLASIVISASSRTL